MATATSRAPLPTLAAIVAKVRQSADAKILPGPSIVLFMGTSDTIRRNRAHDSRHSGTMPTKGLAGADSCVAPNELLNAHLGGHASSSSPPCLGRTAHAQHGGP